MHSHSGNGTLRLEDNAEIPGSFETTVVGNGDMEARSYPVRPFLIRDRVGQKGELHFVGDDRSTAQAQGERRDKSVLRKKLKERNRPTIAASIDAPEMTRLRNRLTHAGDLGDSDNGALELYVELSHILDICILKALGHSGVYRQLATGWKHKSLAESSAQGKPGQ
jgi:hypothetical protein